VRCRHPHESLTQLSMTTSGTNYREKARPALWKSFARSVLLVPAINRVVVASLAAVPAAPWRSRIPVVGSAVLRLDNGAAIVMKRAERCQVAKEIHWGQGRLERACDRLALDLALRLSADADLFLDIGAYTGLFALAVARRNPRVRCDAYEIVPENYLLMVENTIQNNLVGRVHPKLLGLAAAAGTLRVPATIGAGALASSVALDSVAAEGDSTDVPIASLDELYSDFSGRMVIKIDVEGFEWEIFRGARALVDRVRPDMVCEVLRRAPNVPETQAFLEDRGYAIYHITDQGLRLSSRIVPVKRERDWFFTVRAPAELRALGFTVLSEAG